MCLNVIQKDTTNDSVKRTRDKIGFGITLTKDEDGVWVYNRSNSPLFVYSPTLIMPNSRTFSVHRIPSGSSCKIFDFEQLEHLRRTLDPTMYDGPVELSTLSLSFAKGWGKSYTRQTISSCPCWLQVFLTVNRWWNPPLVRGGFYNKCDRDSVGCSAHRFLTHFPEDVQCRVWWWSSRESILVIYVWIPLSGRTEIVHGIIQLSLHGYTALRGYVRSVESSHG